MQPDSLIIESPPQSDLQKQDSKLATSVGPGGSIDLGADLAFQMVLREIVEQACLVTGATGAAIAIYHNSELVCRASHGLTSPPMGSRLDLSDGLSAECLGTRQIQLCNDVQTDLRVDFQACSRLGVHSVVVLPLLRQGEVVGIFEVFSSRRSAFGDREIGILKVLVDRVLKNLERSAQVSVAPVLTEAPLFGAERGDPNPKIEQGEEVSRRWTDVVTWTLATVVLACTGWLSMRVAQQFRWQKTPVRKSAVVVKLPARTANAPLNASADGNAAAVPPSNPNPPATSLRPPEPDRSEASRAPHRAPPEDIGSLRVYENGREVFRMPPSSGISNEAETGVEQASSVQAKEVIKLSASAADSDLIYRVEPEYPEEARKQGIQGAVLLEVHVNSDGSVARIKVVTGQPSLANAAIMAVKQWRFKPLQANGHPAEMQTTVGLNFRLPSEDSIVDKN